MRVKINHNNVSFNTGRALLIQCPSSSAEFKNCKFWFPLSMCDMGKKITLNFGDNWNFNIIKPNKETIEATPQDILDMFEFNSLIDVFETYKPAPIQPQQETILSELIDE